MRRHHIIAPLPSSITPDPVYRRRRELLKLLGLGAVGLSAGCNSPAAPPAATATPPIPGKTMTIARRVDDAGGESQTTYADATHYNNYYEFGTGKADPAANSGRFVPRPWSLEIAGLAEKTGRYTLEDILGGHALEERIYRMRCVEAWSMVIPWIGFPLGDLLKRFKPLAAAKYVAFTTVERPAQMPGLAYPVLDWPYREGLRMDEAMHPLTLLTVGMYGRELPNQNGAPLRLVVPWKYGFKGIKAIVKIEFVERQPRTTWNAAAPDEYGFYSNVNPAVDHPRWSQKTERRIAGTGFNLFGNRIATLPFNGYAEQVAHLYSGMDLRKNF
ncbi:MAG: protein-methionine-sulfoxide reductase catalytic subunit MsrP [Xanthomonadaceae bacterium]|nr:protein-methionine-sulfoxide reductase catalytic subunit MsrP [Xanthomonadaceae bacterium]MDE1961778.1 protein-methionine-sulfoxide reductase catalytic subunit MsrP [Xanthomonadaceae bacterium]MDE2257506.1 protein-methionine-sulfoxide reductase catalytic subunit MsrP [Xanthomonadaceae bacterium]